MPSLTSSQFLGSLHGQICLVIRNGERISINNIIAPEANEIDADAVILVIPKVELVPPQRIFFEVLEERIMRLSSDPPISPSRPVRIVRQLSCRRIRDVKFGIVDWQPAMARKW